MTAVWVPVGDPPPTRGGVFEKEVMQTLRDKLPECFVVIGNPSFPTRRSFFYEYDVLVMSPFLCEVLEAKYISRRVSVYRDHLEAPGGFVIRGVFSRLESKMKVLNGRLAEKPFHQVKSRPRIQSRVVLPSTISIRFRFPDHQRNHKAIDLDSLVKHYKRQADSHGALSSGEKATLRELKRAWEEFRNTTAAVKSSKGLGRFLIAERLSPAGDPAPEYRGVDEPPCAVDVHLKEFLYDSLSCSDNALENYLHEVTREMQTLRRLRHESIRCVIGHFRTGYSLIQVSDWFDGTPLEEVWGRVKEMSFYDKLGLMVEVTRALRHCHDRQVYHRCLSAGRVLLGEGEEIRLTGFEFAKDHELDSTVSTTLLGKREPRLIPPEQLTGAPGSNVRLQDIFQLGVLFYRILEDGAWPYEDAHEYCKTGTIRQFGLLDSEPSAFEVCSLVESMLARDPNERPEVLRHIENSLLSAHRDA